MYEDLLDDSLWRRSGFDDAFHLRRGWFFAKEKNGERGQDEREEHAGEKYDASFGDQGSASGMLTPLDLAEAFDLVMSGGAGLGAAADGGEPFVNGAPVGTALLGGGQPVVEISDELFFFAAL